MSKKLETIGKSSMGMDENVAGLLCYAFQWLTGLIFFLTEKDSKFVKFHALQSLVSFGALTVAAIVFRFFPFIGGLLGTLTNLAQFVLWIFMMIKSYQGEWFEIPVVADIVKKQLNMTE